MTTPTDFDPHYGVFLRLANGPAFRRQLWEVAAHQDRAMTHAWIFTGAPGSGRSVAAKVFAAALLCENSDPMRPGCGECESCRAVFAGLHTDLFHVEPEGLSISVDTVREVVKQASLSPDHGRWRIVIVEDADRLTEGAANAFLKTVEEPPERTVIILCAPSLDPQDIMVTLRSRCRHVYVPTPRPEDVEALLQKEFPQLSAQQVALASRVTGAHIGRARAFLQHGEVRERREEVFALLHAISRGDLAYRRSSALTDLIKKQVTALISEKESMEKEKLLESFGVVTGSRLSGAARESAQASARDSAAAQKELEEKQKRRRTRMIRDMLDLALTDIAAFYRDVVLYQSTGQVEDLINSDKASMVIDYAGQLSPAACLASIDAAMRSRELLAFNVAPDVVFSSLVGRLYLASTC